MEQLWQFNFQIDAFTLANQSFPAQTLDFKMIGVQPQPIGLMFEGSPLGLVHHDGPYVYITSKDWFIAAPYLYLYPGQNSVTNSHDTFSIFLLSPTSDPFVRVNGSATENLLTVPEPETFGLIIAALAIAALFFWRRNYHSFQ